MKFSFLAVILFFTFNLHAADIDWSGVYRFEYADFSQNSLDDSNKNSKSYGIHFLSVRPKIIVNDGISILTRLDFLSNKSIDYANSQIGQTWGGSDYGKSYNGNGGVNNVTRSQQINTNVKVREMYLKVEEEYGALLLGRAPFEFGLGMTHNAGLDPFDHWFDTRDMVAYKFYVGNMSFMPMVSRSYDRGPSTGDMNQEQLIEIIYDNQDAGAKIGVLMERRNAAKSVVEDTVNSTYASALNNGTAPIAVSKFETERTSFLLGRKWETFQFQVEAAFEKGSTGYAKSIGDNIDLNGYGVAAEFDFTPKNSKWSHSIWTGVASGDNPGSTKFEGYQFDRNYDVAMLLFNHRLGQLDFLRTNTIKNGLLDSGNTYDDEAISNASYLSYRAHYDWKEKWKLSTAVVYAQLVDKVNSTSDMKKDLGLELDLKLTYLPRKNVQWVNEIGILSPGEAFKNGSADLKNNISYGFSSKAAISF